MGAYRYSMEMGRRMSVEEEISWRCSNLACGRELDVKIQGTSGWVFCGECGASDEFKATGNLLVMKE